MAEKITFTEFVDGLNVLNKDFVLTMQKLFDLKGYLVEIKPATQGPVLSYLMPKKKRTVINYVFRKSGMQVRIYGDRSSTYQDFIQTLPKSMTDSIEKAPQCRNCNSRCNRGYQGMITGQEYFKCRYSAFLFTLTDETYSFIKAFIEHEVAARELTEVASC